jgi:CHAT domain-containing protein/tetratricopeptide (TPR) repeat protein
MENRKLLVIFLIVFCSFKTFSQKIKVSRQDSLLTLELYSAGIKAGRLGDFDEAINKFYQVYLLRKRIFGENSYRLAPPLNNLGIQYKNQGNHKKAIESYKEAEMLYVSEFGNDYSELGIVYDNLGTIYKLSGDYIKALEYENNAYRILQKDSLRFYENYQNTKYNIIDTQLKLGYNKEAIRFAQSNLKTTLPRLKPRLYDLIAIAYHNEGNSEFAEKNYLNSIKSWKDLLGENNIELIPEYLAYSSFLMAQKQYEKAYEYSTKAESLVLNFYNKKSTTYSEVQLNFGDYFYLKNSEALQIDDFRAKRKEYLYEAIGYYQNAIIALVDSFETKNPMVDPELKNIISEIQLVEALKKKALAMEKMGDLYLSEFNYQDSKKFYQASLNSLTNAVVLVHRLQIGFENEDSRLFLSQNQEATYYDAIKVSYKLYNQTKNPDYLEMAFEFSERSKSSNLLASVTDIKAKEFGGIPDTLLERENYLKGNIANYTSMLYEEKHAEKEDTQKINLYSAKIFKFNEEYNKLISSFEESYPQYYSLKYENKVIRIADIQSRLNARQALVEYYSREPEPGSNSGEIYCFVISKDSVRFFQEQIDQKFAKEIQFVHDFLISPNYLNTKKKDFIDYSISAYHLYEKLFHPFAETVAGKSLTIIPHDKLSYIPFDALLSQMPDTSSMNFRNLKYLVLDYPISYSYSATLLYNYFTNKKVSEKNLLIFSPQYIVNEPRTDGQGSKPYFLSPLSGAKDEVKGISRYINSDSFVDLHAQEQTFKDKASQYDILHLAMHTIINDSLPMFSKLVFSTPDQKSSEDGFLNTFEIYNMKLNARLAVLSACETGTGKLQKGEGVMSMARGFIYAGCPSIVMTLWKVEDKSGVKIMEDFYSYLSKGKPKDVALRMAKLNHLNHSDPLAAHPHFWLGYVNIGNPEPLYTSKDVYFIIFLFSVILIVFANWYIRKKPRKSRGSYN